MFYSEYCDDKNYTSGEDNDSDWEESSGEDDESSDSNTEELPIEEKKNRCVGVYIGKTDLLFNGVQVLP